MQIFVHRNNQQTGPFTEDEIKAQLAAGSLSLQDHVWWQGQANWVPLGQTSIVPAGIAPLPGGALAGTPAAATFVPGSMPVTSKLAVASLVCGCLSLFCSLLASIPAIILGHMGLAAIKKDPTLQGKGMAMAGTIIGYLFTVLIIGSILILVSLGNQVKDVFKTISSQMAEAQAAPLNNNADQSSTTNSDSTTNSSDQTTTTPTPATTPDQSTNAPTATPSSGNSNTNTPAPVNAPPTNQ